MFATRFGGIICFHTLLGDKWSTLFRLVETLENDLIAFQLREPAWQIGAHQKTQIFGDGGEFANFDQALDALAHLLGKRHIDVGLLVHIAL